MDARKPDPRASGARGPDQRTPDPRALAYLRGCPKVEFHVHLEGAIRPRRLLQVMRRNGLHPHLQTLDDLAPLYRHTDFAQFLEHFRFVVLCLRRVEDIHDVALDLFRELVAQQVVYAEVIFSAAVFVRAGMPLDALLDAVTRAEATAVQESERRDVAAPRAVTTPRGVRAAPDAATSHAIHTPRFNLVLDVVRNFGAEAARAHVAAAIRLQHPRVVGIHLGGDEVGYPARDFAAAYATAAEAGLGRAAHAGEAAGAVSVREAVDVLGARRIGHGIRAVEDADLVRELVARDIVLEVCPTSNLRTGVVSQLDAHPLPALLQAGVRATLGADDPSFFDTSLTRELELAHAQLGLDVATLDVCTDDGLRAAFTSASERAARLHDLLQRRSAALVAAGLVS